MRIQRIISKEKPHSFATEQYKKLKTNIDYLSIDKDYQIINVTSTLPNEGKTFTSLNLSHVYAQSKTKTLLIDMDLRNPKIHRVFHLSNDFGVSSLHESKNDLDTLIQKVDDYLYVLPAGPKFPYPSELLSSSQIVELFKQLRSKFSKIIIDTPPVSIFADSKIISNISDGTLYVIASKKTRIDLTKSAIRELEMSDVDIIGTVLTRVPSQNLFYGKEYYYKKYQKID